MILPILKYGDPHLTSPTRIVEEISDEIRKLVINMIETMHAEPGIGLAANQVGSPHKVAAVDLSVGENPEDLIVLVNPEIIESSGEQADEEGCLSLPEIKLEVKRPQRVLVRAMDLEGREYEINAENLLARALCHEIDHINGVVIIDYLTGMAKEMTLTKIKRYIRQGLWD